MKKHAKLSEINDRFSLENRNGKKIVMVNGCFDIFHVGHLELLQGAKSLGDYLIVGVNSDQSYISYRKCMPYFSLLQRMTVIAALECVDYVFSFDESTLCSSLEKIIPDYYALGIDKINKPMFEIDTCIALDIPYYFIGKHKIASSSEIKKHLSKNSIFINLK